MKRRRKLYTTNEQYQILNYIIDHSAYFLLKGNKIWKDMELANICPGRTWQSMKEHFSCKISKNIQSFNIDEKEKDRIMNGFSKNYCNELDNRKNKIDFSNSEDDVPLKKRKIKAASSSDNTEKIYTTNEQYQILNYIIDHSAHFLLKGNKIWKDMELANICPGRTWQSMKEHFSCKISKNIQSFNIDEKEKDRIMNGFSKNYCNELDNRKNKIDFSDSEDDVPLKKRKIKAASSSDNTEKIYTINSAYDNANQNLLNSISHDSIDNAVEPCSKEYSNEDDIKIINFFKTNMDWLNLKYEDSVYEYLQVKCSFQKSIQSLKKRFLNYILPNLYKYNVMEIADMLVFYDKARVQIPDELVAIIDTQLELRESEPSDSQTTCIDNRDTTTNVSKENSNTQINDLDVTLISTDTTQINLLTCSNNIQTESNLTQKDSNFQSINSDKSLNSTDTTQLNTIKNIFTQTTPTDKRHTISNTVEQQSYSEINVPNLIETTQVSLTKNISDNSIFTNNCQINSNRTKCNSDNNDLDETLTSNNTSEKNSIKIISNIVINPGRVKKLTKNSATNTDNIEQKDAETQYYPPKKHLVIRCLSDNIMVKSNSVTHVFVLNTKENLETVKQNIENKFHVQSENIHELSTEDFNTLTNFRKLFKTINKKIKSELYKHLEEPIDVMSKSRFNRIICPAKKKKGIVHLPLKKIINHQTEICTGCKRKCKKKFHNKINETKNIAASTENNNITVNISVEENNSANISQTNEINASKDNIMNETHTQSNHSNQSNVSIISIESNNSILDKIWDIKHKPKTENTSPRSISSSFSSVSLNDTFSQNISDILNNLICTNTSPTSDSDLLTQSQESSIYNTEEVFSEYLDNININDQSEIDYNPEITIKDETKTNEATVIRSSYFAENLNISDDQNLNLNKSEYPSALTTEQSTGCDYNFLNSICITNVISLSDISSEAITNQSKENNTQNDESNSSTIEKPPKKRKIVKKSPVRKKRKKRNNIKSITKQRERLLPSSEILKTQIVDNFKHIVHPKINLSKRTIDKIKNQNLNINHLNILTKDMNIDQNFQSHNQLTSAKKLYLETTNKIVPSYNSLSNEGFISHFLDNTEN